MFGTSSLSVGAGVTAVGAAALLISQYGSVAATPEAATAPAIRTAALPLEFNVNQTFPWALAPAAAISSTGAATVSAVSQYANGFKLGVGAALQTANQLGPLTFGLNSIKSIVAQQDPNRPQQSTINVTDLDQWALGLAGLANSAGAIGFVDNVAWYDPFIGTHAGFLQTANSLGPAFFNLNVLKAIGLTQAQDAAGGGVLGSGQPDDWSAVDIGRWSAGIPGIITNTGTTGFVFSLDFGNGPVNAYFAGGLHTTTKIGSMVFDFNFIPSIRTSLFPPGLVISLAPDLTAAETEFAGINPPPPGTINPPVTNPLPLKTAAPSAVSALAAPVAPTVTDPAPAVTEGADAGVTKVANVQTAEVDDTTPTVDDTPAKVEIPGVNGVPLSGAPSTKPAGSGRNDPFKPLRSFTDSVKKGIEKLTGTGPKPAATSGAGTPSTGGASTTSGGAGAGSSGEGSSSAGSSGGSDSSNG
ncbi:hypothetical protein D8S82_12605 [Mycobacterium hodleri]|uniref:Uncharacterized protein n=1 Tax=Mycolicibacterium hodleri TaxID=49897 RepID=A0A544W1Q2_9MYCO|nr:hypothetical protein [Mycolicibacterium hodleri]TQR86153.1 hypothetical protein D8S82_12605 [Mycolicibacterium hodleri]